jgi:amino acid adenylation domain-containing protein
MKEDFVTSHDVSAQNPFSMGQYEQMPSARNTSQNFSLHTTHIHELFEAQVERTPQAIAVVYEQQTLSYHELNQRANQLAHYLCQQGVGPEIIVGICLERSLHLAIAVLAVLKAGGTCLPLDFGYPQERLTFMLTDTQAVLLLTEEYLLPQLPSANIPICCLDTSNWQATVSEQLSPSLSFTCDELPAYIIYTSGSTGQPKGVVLTHRGLLNRLYWGQQTYPLTHTDRIVHKAPFNFDFAIWELFGPWLAGAQVIMARPGGQRDTAYLVKLITQHKITVIHMIPSLLRVFLEEPGIEACHTLRYVFGGAEALSFAVQERFYACLQAELINLYGPTEASIDTTHWTCVPQKEARAVPIGHPIAHTEVYLLNRDLQSVQNGVTGEVYISGKGLARGYLHRPDLTAELFLPHPWSDTPGQRLYKTGDTARYGIDGVLEYMGRSDQQIKLRGYRIELGEIETVLKQHSAVQEAVVQVYSDGQEPSLVAYLLGQRGVSLSVTDVQDFLRQRLPDYMRPTFMMQLEQFPLTMNGKVDRSKLPAPETMVNEAAKECIQPRDSMELHLVQLWERLLNVHPVGITDDFFALGGHSFLAVRLMQHIKKQFGYAIPLMELFEQPTIEHLARLLRQPFLTSKQLHLVTFKTAASRRPLFFIHPVGGTVLCYLELAQALEKQAFYGIQAAGLYGERDPLTTIEDMAAIYLQTLKTVQPAGPYLLGGWSMGGVIAFEMAQQLVKHGEEVALLALLDCQVHEPGIVEEVDQARLLTDFVIHLVGSYLNSATPEARQRFRHLDEQDALAFHKEVQQVSMDRQLSFVLEQTKQAGLVPSDTDLSQFTHYFAVFRTNYQAVRHYQPEPYTGRATFFASEDVMKWKGLGPAMGWDRLITENLEAHVLPGNHYTLIHGATVRRIAEQLLLTINRIP